MLLKNPQGRPRKKSKNHKTIYLLLALTEFLSCIYKINLRSFRPYFRGRLRTTLYETCAISTNFAFSDSL